MKASSVSRAPISSSPGDIDMITSPDLSFLSLCDKAYSDGYAFHGDLDLSTELFNNRLKLISEKHLIAEPVISTSLRFLKGLHTNDLYLSLACAQLSEKAWDRFANLYHNYIRGIARFVLPNLCAASDVAENLVGHLFLPDSSGRSRIASYDGQTSMATWLRVIITRLAINERDRKSSHEERLEVLPDIVDHLSVYRIESGARASKYEAIIKEAFKVVSESLSKRERLVVLLRYEKALPAQDIARLLEVHPSTITRLLHHAYQQLQSEFITILTSEHRLNEEAVEECVAEVLENPGYSILTALRMLLAV